MNTANATTVANQATNEAQPRPEPKPNATATIDRRKLAKALSRLADTSPRRSPKKILTNALISVNGAVTLYATDMERSQLLALPAEHTGDATALVDFALMRKVVTSSKAKTVQINLYDDAVTINSAKLTTADIDEYPEPPQLLMNDNGSFTVKGPELLAAVKQAIECTDWEVSRYALGGALFELTRELRVVATDGRRLSCNVISATDNGWREPENALIVPALALKALSRVLTHDKTTDVVVTYAETTLGADVQFATDSDVIRTRTLEGRFPKYRDVIPNRATETRIGISASNLVQSLAEIAHGFDSLNSRVTVSVGADSVDLSATTELGTFKSTCKANVVYPGSFDDDGAPEYPTLITNGKILLGWLKTLDKSTELVLGIDSDKPESAALDFRAGAFVSPDSQSTVYDQVYVQMPLSRD